MAFVGLLAVVVSVGGLIWVGHLLVRPDTTPGRRYLGVVLFAVPLTAVSAGVGFVSGVFLSIALFGFDLDGTAPWWDRHLPTCGAGCGALVGTATATLLVRFWQRTATGGYPDQAEDYDDRGPGDRDQYDDDAPRRRRRPPDDGYDDYDDYNRPPRRRDDY